MYYVRLIICIAPICRNCGPPYKTDVKCTKCQNFYAHSLCLNHEKTDVRLCVTCRPDVTVIRVKYSKVRYKSY